MDFDNLSLLEWIQLLLVMFKVASVNWTKRFIFKVYNFKIIYKVLILASSFNTIQYTEDGQLATIFFPYYNF